MVKKPSTSTLASGAAGLPVSVIFSWLLELAGVSVTTEVATAAGVILSTLIGYFFKGGKDSDVAK